MTTAPGETNKDTCATPAICCTPTARWGPNKRQHMKFTWHVTLLTVCHFLPWIPVTYVTSLSVICPSLPPSHSLLPPMPALVTISFVSLLNQSFSFRPELISPSLIVDAILQSALHYLIQSYPAPSSALFLLLYLVLHLSCSAFHCNSLQMGRLCSVFLVGNLLRVVEQCLDWMWLALQSILCCRIGAMHKILCWQLAVLYCEDRLPVSQAVCVKVYWCIAFLYFHSASHLS